MRLKLFVWRPFLFAALVMTSPDRSIDHGEVLAQLCRELFSATEWRLLQALSATHPLDRRRLIEFDDSFAGPSLSRISLRGGGGPGTLGIPGQGVGRYEVADRDVFRPLQYCAAYLMDTDRIEWLTRDIIEMSCVHIEELAKRIARISFLPLGALLLRSRLRRKLDPITLDRLERFTGVYNRAKHDFDQAKDTHMFSIQDAVLSYAAARRLAVPLYPLATLVTDLRFEGDPHSENASL